MTLPCRHGKNLLACRKLLENKQRLMSENKQRLMGALKEVTRVHLIRRNRPISKVMHRILTGYQQSIVGNIFRISKKATKNYKNRIKRKKEGFLITEKEFCGKKYKK